MDHGLSGVNNSKPYFRKFCDGGVLSEGLRKPFGAYAILHTGRLLIITIGTINHELFDKFKQHRMVLRKPRGHEAVNLLWGMQLDMRLENNNDVSMRKAPLLKLYSIKKACNFTKHAILNVFDEGMKLGMKDMCDQVRTLSSCLVVKQLILNFRLGSICSHGDEKVTSFKMLIDG